MLLVPFQVSATEFNVFVILQESNLERIRAHDPGEVTVDKMGEPWSRMKLSTVIIGYATDAEYDEIASGKQTDTRTILKNLSRGFRFRPEDGDHDGAYPRAGDPES